MCAFFGVVQGLSTKEVEDVLGREMKRVSYHAGGFKVEKVSHFRKFDKVVAARSEDFLQEFDKDEWEKKRAGVYEVLEGLLHAGQAGGELAIIILLIMAAILINTAPKKLLILFADVHHLVNSDTVNIHLTRFCAAL